MKLKKSKCLFLVYEIKKFLCIYHFYILVPEDDFISKSLQLAGAYLFSCSSEISAKVWSLKTYSAYKFVDK